MNSGSGALRLRFPPADRHANLRDYLARDVFARYPGYEAPVAAILSVAARYGEGSVYRALYGQRGLWVRPHAMFFSPVVVHGHAQPRFAFVSPDLPPDH